MWRPVHFEEIDVEDIVFCQVQPGARFFGHLIQSKEWQKEQCRHMYWISNLKGRINGWCYLDTIYGKLFQIQR